MPSSSEKIQAVLGQKKLFYVTREVERATAGLLLNLANYRIITNNSPYAKRISTEHENVIIASKKEVLDTWELLESPTTKKLIAPGDFVLVFKNTKRIEEICQKNNWQLLNPSAALASAVEEKISQIEWLGPLTKYLPPFKVDICKNIKWEGKEFILQFNRAHTGSGTILITSEKQMEEIKAKFPQRDVRVTEYIQGPLFTNNNIVWGNNILQGNISYQITGIKPFTDNPFATIGNDWALPHKILSVTQKKQYQEIANAVGERLRDNGWKGLFGIDTILDEKTGQIFLLEINARQPASTTYESELQKSNTTFEAHLCSLLNIPQDNFLLQEITDGAQIIQRVTAEIRSLHEPKLLKPEKINYIYYNNTEPGSDLLRMQRTEGVMQAHGELNRLGLETMDFMICARGGNQWNATRAGAILIKDGKILLMKRQKYGQNYYTLPGGTMEPDETPLDTAKREIFEETGISFEPVPEKPIYLKERGRDEYYFVARNFIGEGILGGIEKDVSNKDYNYELNWVPIDELDGINLLPKTIVKFIYDQNLVGTSA